MGPVLQREADLETRSVREVAQSAAGLSADFKTLSPHVCRYRHRRRQRPPGPLRTVGAVDRKVMPASVPRQAYAGAGSPREKRGSVRHSAVAGDSVGCGQQAISRESTQIKKQTKI